MVRIRGERVGRGLGIPPLPALCVGLWLALVAAVVVLSRATGKTFDVCILKRLTGIPCPSCGTTRGTIVLLDGDVAGALAMNPLFVTGAVAIMILMALRLLGGIRLRLETTPGARRVVLAAAATALVLNWAFVIAMGR